MDAWQFGWLAGMGMLSALAGLLLLGAMLERGAGKAVFLADGAEADFLFDGETLVDATPAARALLPHSPLAAGTPWARLSAWLLPRFPTLGEALERLPAEGRVALASAEDCGPPVLLVAEVRGGLTRIRLGDPDAPEAGPGDGLAGRAALEELETLRAAAAHAPLPIWRENAAGEVVWANLDYLDLALHGLDPAAEMSWPLPRVFAPGAAGRLRIDLGPDHPGRWFDLGPATPGGGLRFALPADAAAAAEAALRSFQQTLAKTFAHLPIGLAIFDQARRLVLFNPALIDLTGLPPEFLAGRPTLAALLDTMRERAMLPEPRDYRGWRRQMTEMEEAAAHGLYEEVWTLPGGQTYRVAGRPHPNGALALMFEDISSETTQTRRYRADLELGQAVIDAMDEAIAVFSASGTLVLSNAAYTALWGHDPAGTLDGTADAAALCEHWRGLTAPSTVWDRLEDFAAATGAQRPWSDDVFLADGREVRCRFARLSGGATLAGFRVAPPPEPAMAVFASARRSA